MDSHYDQTTPLMDELLPIQQNHASVESKKKNNNVISLTNLQRVYKSFKEKIPVWHF